MPTIKVTVQIINKALAASSVLEIIPKIKNPTPSKVKIVPILMELKILLNGAAGSLDRLSKKLLPASDFRKTVNSSAELNFSIIRL